MVTRGAQIDPTLCFLTTLSLYALLRHLLLGPAWRWYFVGGFAAGLGIFTKGVGLPAAAGADPVFSLLRGFAGRVSPTSMRAGSAGAGGWRRWRCCVGLAVVRAHAAGRRCQRFARVRRLSRRNPVQANRESLCRGVASRQALVLLHRRSDPGAVAAVEPAAVLAGAALQGARSTNATRASGCRSAGAAWCCCSSRRVRASAASTSCRRCRRWRSPRCRSRNCCWRAPACGGQASCWRDVLHRWRGAGIGWASARDIRR